MDPYFKKEIFYSIARESFKFAVGNTLFSSFDIDKGTDILLRYISAEPHQSILDYGCGYGPIGIVLARKFPESQVTMIDKDLLAVRYSKLNINLNKIYNAKVIGSVGTEAVQDQSFDLIVSNVPAKIGDVAIEEDFILAPVSLLNPGGTYWIVVVNALNRLIPRICRKHELSYHEIKKRAGHTVYKIRS